MATTDEKADDIEEILSSPSATIDQDEDSRSELIGTEKPKPPPRAATGRRQSWAFDPPAEHSSSSDVVGVTAESAKVASDEPPIIPSESEEPVTHKMSAQSTFDESTDGGGEKEQPAKQQLGELKSRRKHFGAAASRAKKKLLEKAAELDKSIELKSYGKGKGKSRRRGSLVKPMTDEEQGSNEEQESDAEISKMFDKDAEDSFSITAAKEMFSPTHSRHSSAGGSTAPSAAEQQSLSLPPTQDLSESMRARRAEITRKRAKSVVEKSKSDIRLTKRMERRETLINFDVPIHTRDEESRVEEALDKSVNLRQRLQAEREKTGPKIKLPSEAEKYDFFTKTYEEERKTAVSVQPDEEPGAGTDETTALLGLESEIAPMVVFAGPKIVPYFAQIRAESDVYFTPSILPVPLSRKIQTGDVRRAEEEGLYTGPNPDIPSRNISALEQRLLLDQPDQGKGWFDEGGNVIRMKGGIASFPLRPEFSDRIITVYCKAIVGGSAGSGATKVLTTDGLYKLDVDVAQLAYTHHPLFSRENVAAVRLLQHYRHWLTRREDGLSEYYNLKMKAMKQGLEQLETLVASESFAAEHPSIVETKRKISSIHMEVRELRSERNRQLALDRQLLHKMLAAWQTVKRLRQQQGHCNTNYQLLLRRQTTDAEKEKREWEADLKEELLEREYEWTERSVESVDEPSETQEEEEGKQRRRSKRRKSATFDRETELRRIQEANAAFRRLPGEPNYLPTLGSGVSITPYDDCPEPERRRRDAIARRRIRLQVFFDDVEVCTTAPRPLNTDFAVTFNELYTLHVYQWPHGLNIKIYESVSSPAQKSGEWHESAVVGVPLPDAQQIRSDAANTYGQSLDDLQFSSPLTEPPDSDTTAVGAGTATAWSVITETSFATTIH